MVKSAPSAHTKNANLELIMLFAPTVAIETWLPIVSVTVEWNAKIFGIVTDSQREWLDFANRRLAAHMTLSHNLGTCRSLQQVGSVYADFFQKAAIDYRERFGEIAEPEVQALSATNNRDTSCEHIGQVGPFMTNARR